jgi:hypothetical protein
MVLWNEPASRAEYSRPGRDRHGKLAGLTIFEKYRWFEVVPGAETWSA